VIQAIWIAQQIWAKAINNEAMNNIFSPQPWIDHLS
jgi:hypothetical protein